VDGRCVLAIAFVLAEKFAVFKVERVFRGTHPLSEIGHARHPGEPDAVKPRERDTDRIAEVRKTTWMTGVEFVP
jgi:hypothetical protein